MIFYVNTSETLLEICHRYILAVGAYENNKENILGAAYECYALLWKISCFEFCFRGCME